jgi:hypothetical protein
MQGRGKPVGAAMALALIVATAQRRQDSVVTEDEQDAGPDPVGETFGDGGIPCWSCKRYVEDHELSNEKDERGRRIWVCPKDGDF